MSEQRRKLRQTERLMRYLITFIAALLASSAQAAPEDRLFQLENEGKALEARIEVKRLASTGIGQQSWRRVRSLLIQHPEWGEDLLRFVWDKVGLERNYVQDISLNDELDDADRTMLAKEFRDALQVYRNALKNTPHREPGAAYLQLALARAQYGSREFKSSLETYTKISPTFSRYRQVLFEQMWAAFRAGEVDLALGAIASQSSRFFSKFLDPESYLIKVYLFKRLCRDQEAEETLKEVKAFQSAIKKGSYDYREWARSEPITRALLALVENYADSEVTSREQDKEVSSIKSSLKKSFELNKARLIEDLESVSSFAVLAVTPGMETGLKPIQKIRNRGDLLERGLEIWPSDDEETWADEIGKHRFIGESQCGSQRES